MAQWGPPLPSKGELSNQEFSVGCVYTWQHVTLVHTSTNTLFVKNYNCTGTRHCTDSMATDIDIWFLHGYCFFKPVIVHAHWKRLHFSIPFNTIEAQVVVRA